MKKGKILITLSVIFVASLLTVFSATDTHAGINIGGGGYSGGNGGANEGSCGGSTGVVCPMTLWVYYTLNDRSQPAYIGSHNPYAGDLTISDCGDYGGFWIYQRTSNEESDKGTALYRVATGARQRSSWLNGNATSVTMIPLKGVYNDENSNVTPQIPNWPDCASDKSCGKESDDGWPESDAQVQEYFKENNGGELNCTIGTYTGNCFGNSSPLTYFCYGDYIPTEYTYTLQYDANGGSNAPSSQSETTTDSGYTFTVKGQGSMTRAGYNFLGWSTSSTASSGSYWGDSTIYVTGTTTLYAVWGTTATFSGSVATPYSNSDTAIKAQDGANLLGDGVSTSFNIKTTYTITRTNSTPSSATSYYDTSTSSQPASVGTTSVTLSNGYSSYPTENNTQTVDQAVGTKGSHCFYLTYENNVAYNGSSRGGTTIDKKNACTTLYNPLYATFSSAIPVASSNMNEIKAGKFRGNGYDTTDYKLTAYYQVIRNDEDSPATAKSRYAFKSDSRTYPTTPVYTTAELSKNQKTTAPETIKFNLGNGVYKTKCFSLSYDNRVGYVDGSILTSPFDTREFNGRNQTCVDVYNPKRWDAAFSGSISVANGRALSGSTNTNGGTDNARTGNGLHSRYSLTPTYTVTRINNSPPFAVAPQYAYSDSSYPTSASDTFKALSENESDSATGSAKTRDVDIDVDTAVRQCFYLSFDNQVTYIENVTDEDTMTGDATFDKRFFNGRQISCYAIKNPHQSYTAHYSASTDGALDAHTQLNRTNNNREGTIDNQTRILGTNTDADGSWVDNFPKKSDGTPDDKYTATFTHVLKRTDEDKSSTASTTYYVGTTPSAWQVQYCEDAGCSANYYRNYTASLDNNSRAEVGGTANLTAGATKTITVNPKWTLNASNKGKVVRMCQRIAYRPSALYWTATNTTNRDSYVDSFQSYGDWQYTSPICVTLKNPYWKNDILQGYPYHYIDVDGATPSSFATGARMLNASQRLYETLELNATLYFHHSLTRHDNWNVAGRNTTNFDETDRGVNFFQPSIYGDPHYTVGSTSSSRDVNGYTSVSSQLKYWGYEQLGTNSHHLKCPYSDLSRGTKLNGYPVQLNARNKSTGDTWSSNENQGITDTVFTAQLTDIARNSGGCDARIDYSLLAGITKTVSHTTFNQNASWYVRYKTLYRQEVYTGWAADQTRPQYYDRTEKHDTKPQLADIELVRESSGNANTSFSITRPYNYQITNVSPRAVPEEIAYADSEFSIDYKVHVNPENNVHNYLTDPNMVANERFVHVVRYVLPANVDYRAAGTNTQGSANVNSLCAHFTLAKPGSCKDISEGDPDANTSISHEKKLKRLGDNGTPNPNGGVAFRNVYTYNRNGYDIGYSTKTIKVPTLGVGEKFCVAIAIRNWSSNDASSYFISNSICRNVSKQPNLQNWGSSTLADGVVTSRLTYGNKYYGSWTDMMLIANGNVKYMASGAALAGGVPTNTTLCNLNRLTVSNTDCSNESSASALGNAFIDNRLGVLERLNLYLPTDSYTLGNLPGNPVPRGTYVVRSNSTVTITRNIELSDLRSMVFIIAPNINIADNVTRLDAVLIASNANGSTVGTVNTCTTSSGGNIPLSNSVCTNQLRVNGAIIARNILFRRTANADPASGTTPRAAEIINYSPAITYWGYIFSRDQNNPEIVYRKKLPPRY